MAMVKVSSKLHNHPKLIKLKDSLGSDAVLSLFRLWLWCADKGSNEASEMEVRRSGYHDETPVARPMHWDVHVDADGANWYEYISTLVDLEFISMKVGKGADGTAMYDVANPYTPLDKEVVDPKRDSEIQDVIASYMSRFPNCPWQGVNSKANRKHISDRLDAGWTTKNLADAIDGMSQTEWYRSNTDLGLKYAVNSCDKVLEHITKLNKKPQDVTKKIGHHEGSREFDNGRSSSF